MYKEYKGEFFPKIEVQELFDGDYNKIAYTLGYNSFQDVLADQSMTYNLNKHNPFLIPDMEKFVQIVYEHIKLGSNILVFGDFDVDGISASAVLIKALLYAGHESVDVLIPNREIGYSIKREYIIEYVNNINNPKPDLIITVDCGVKSASDIEYIVDVLGIEVVVTDHHGVDEKALPLAASACVNPHRRNSEYPFQEISGSLVALKAMEALDEYVLDKTGKSVFITGPQGRANGVMDELQELAMLGTIADVMPIINENKWLVKDTLTRLGYSKNTGLRVFTNNLRKAYNDSGSGTLNTDFVGWQIGPRINAAGRIGNPYMGLSMFLTESKDEADNIFASLNSVNKERQDIMAEDYNIALTAVKKSKLHNGIVYVDGELNDGIIGLIAGKLKEEFYRPTIAIGGRSLVIDVVYDGLFSEEQEMAMYQILFAINQRYFEENQTDLFHGSSIKDGNKIMFSISESKSDVIEDEFFNVFDNLEDFVYENFKNSSKKEQEDLLYVLSEINFSALEFKYSTIFKGSCRSVAGFDITEALDILNEEYRRKNGVPLLLGFGGHPMAAGFGIAEGNVSAFKRLFEQYTNKHIKKDTLKKELSVNIEVTDFSLINTKLVNMIYSMGPYGNRNEYPKVLLIGKPVYAEVIGRNQTTVKMFLEDDRGVQVEMLFFRYKDKEEIRNFCEMVLNDPSSKNYNYGIVGTLEVNSFNNTDTVQLKPMDIVYLD